MQIFGKRYNSRGVSVIIAALLLIAIAVAAAVLLYVFSIGLLGSLQATGGQQTKEELIMEAYNWNPPTALAINLRNVGSNTVQFGDVLINGILVVPASTGCMAGTHTLAVESTCALSFTSLSGYKAGLSYVIKIITADGGIFSYSATAGSSE
jgi:hypothetical protein